MANVSVYNMEGSEVDKIDLNDKVFAVEVNSYGCNITARK